MDPAASVAFQVTIRPAVEMNAFASPHHWRRPAQLRATRAPVVLDASIVTINAYQFPQLADISQTGAKLRGSPLPPKGTSALLRVNGLEVLCRVIWVKGEACGIRFDEPVAPAMLKQIQLDGAVAPDPTTTEQAGQGADVTPLAPSRFDDETGRNQE